MHSKFPWVTHPHTPTAVFDGDGRRIIDQWVAPDDWQDIETAPRDGTRILATGGGLEEEIEVVSYNDSVGAWDTKEWTLDDTDDGPDGYNRPTRWRPLPAPPSDAPTPAPLDPDTAAANAVMIAGLPGLIEALDAMVLVCGRTGDALEDFEEQAEVFLRETGFMRPGKDMPAGWDSEDNSGARRAKYSEWVQSKLTAGRAALASIGRTL